MRSKGNFQSVGRYLNEIEGYAPLSAAEEIALAQRIRNGDMQAHEKLVKANLRFVVAVAVRYQGLGLPLPDLISEGNLGLLKAAQKFDESRGFKFVSYAVWWIRQAIMMALAEHCRIVRLPVNRLTMMRKVESAAEKLKGKFGREPSVEEISQSAEIATYKTVEALADLPHYVSLDAPYIENESTSLLDLLPSDQQDSPDASLLEESLHDEIGQMISRLPAREAEIIRIYFGLEGNHPQTLEQIGQRLNLTRERVRQIKENALLRLRRRAAWEKWRKTNGSAQCVKVLC
jgi:RNA polymerase primary sigma factor